MKEELQLSKNEIVDLKKQLLETEGTNNEANRYLADQWEKTKQSRAQLRCDYLQLKREHQRLLDERQSFDETQKSAQASSEIACQELKREIEKLNAQLEAMEKDHVELTLENTVLKANNNALEKKVVVF